MAIPKFLVALALVGVIDAISYMVVAPSIVFYVLENGGSREQYGIIMSAFSFSSFCAKPFVGWWSDQHGFRFPYMICLIISSLGGLVYLMASAFDDGRTAVALILTGRLLGGVGAASSALGFAYLAKAVAHEEQTKTNSLLSMTRILGMATGPALNVFLADINTNIFGFALNSLNSVGLVLMTTNLLALASVFFLLDEPSTDHTAPRKDNDSSNEKSPRGHEKLFAMMKALCCWEIMVPIFSIFAFNANFQLIECALAPAANHGMGWTPVGISGILGSVSIIIFINMIVVFSLSARKVKDSYILMFGASLATVGYVLVWYLWKWKAEPWEFILPVIVGVSAFPYLGAPTRSVYTKAVDSLAILDGNQGAMQALLSMFASVAGFTAPGLVATYVLRDPEDVENDPSRRELTPWALVSPLMSVFIFWGVLVVHIQSVRKEKEVQVSADVLPDESSSLVDPNRRQSSIKAKQRFSTGVEVNRRSSVAVMGMVQYSMYEEHCMHEDYDSEEEETPTVI